MYAVRVLKFRTYWYDYLTEAASPEEARATVQGLLDAALDGEEDNYFDGLHDDAWDFEEDSGYRIQSVREHRP